MPYALWVAEWSSKLNYSGTVGIWQYSATGKISGISGDVDLDTAYVDYTSSVKKAGLNGYKKQNERPVDSITIDVTIDGKKYSGKLNKT